MIYDTTNIYTCRIPLNDLFSMYYSKRIRFVVVVVAVLVRIFSTEIIWKKKKTKPIDRCLNYGMCEKIH